MRIRNLKNKKEILDNCSIVIKEPIQYRGKWKNLFNNNNPIYIEIGSGKCKFIFESAIKNPDINYIGIEKLDTVLALGIKDIAIMPKNVFLINYDANLIEQLFFNEIDKLYLNFSDPWPKERHEKRRLTSSNLLQKYETIFKKDKCIELKTDNQTFFEYSIVSLNRENYLIKEVSFDLHNSLNNDNIMTEYEEKFVKKGCNIFFLKALKK